MSDDEILTGLREISRANATPLHDALDRIGTHGEGFELDAARTTDGRISAEASGTKALGKGWTVSGGIQWAKDTGAAALGKLTWTPKQKGGTE